MVLFSRIHRISWAQYVTVAIAEMSESSPFASMSMSLEPAPVGGRREAGDDGADGYVATSRAVVFSASDAYILAFLR